MPTVTDTSFYIYQNYFLIEKVVNTITTPHS